MAATANDYTLSLLFQIVDKAGAPLNNIGKSFNSLNQKVKEFGNTASHVSKQPIFSPKGGGEGGMFSFLSKGAMSNLTKFGGAVGAALGIKEIFSQIMSFDTAMAKIASRIPNDVNKLEQLRLAIQETAMDSGKSTDELGSAMLALVQNFEEASSSDLMGKLKSAMLLAKLGFSDTAGAVDYLARSTKEYGRSSPAEMEKVAAMTFQAMKKADVNLGEFSGTISGMLPTAKELGMSLEELYSFFITFAEGKEQFSQVGTAMNFMMNQFVQAGTAGKKAGENLSDMDTIVARADYRTGAQLLRKEGMVGAIQHIKKYADDTGMSMGQLLGGKTAKFAERINATKLKEQTQNLKNLAYAADEARRAATRYDEVNQATKEWNKFWETLKIFGMNLGTLVLPVFSKTFYIIGEILRGTNRSLWEFKQGNVVKGLTGKEAKANPITDFLFGERGALNPVAFQKAWGMTPGGETIFDKFDKAVDKLVYGETVVKMEVGFDADMNLQMKKIGSKGKGTKIDTKQTLALQATPK